MLLNIDETIAKEKEEAKRLRKIIETGYDGEISIEAMFCDDTDAIKEAYERFENCAKEHEQYAEWLEELKDIKSDGFTDDLLNMGFTKGYSKALEELKVIKEMDLSIPQHFTKEQSDWIKKYCINRNKEFYNKALDDFVKFASDMPTVEEEDGTIRPMWLEEMAEKLKGKYEELYTNFKIFVNGYLTL